MKFSLSVLSISALLLSGCGSPGSAAAGGTSGSCVYAGKAHGQGAMSCQDRTQFRCENGVWNSTFKGC